MFFVRNLTFLSFASNFCIDSGFGPLDFVLLGLGLQTHCPNYGCVLACTAKAPQVEPAAGGPPGGLPEGRHAAGPAGCLHAYTNSRTREGLDSQSRRVYIYAFLAYTYIHVYRSLQVNKYMRKG